MSSKRTIDDETTLDILDRFTDPERRLKKAKKQKEIKEKKLEQLLNMDKKFAKDYFNEDINKQTYQEWSKHISNNISNNIDELKTKLNELENIIDPNHILYPPEKKEIPHENNNDELMPILKFIETEYYCMDWLQKKTNELGWKENITGYNPIIVSHSIPELIKSTFECYKMMIKQMILYLQSSHYLQSSQSSKLIQ